MNDARVCKERERESESDSKSEEERERKLACKLPEWIGENEREREKGKRRDLPGFCCRSALLKW